MLKKALAIFLVFTLVWGKTGFCLNVHYCETSEAISLMVNHIIGEKCSKNDKHDHKASSEFGETKSCCQKLAQTLPSAKKDCCSDTEVELKINDVFQGSFHQIQLQKQLDNVLFVSLADCFCHYTVLPAHVLSIGGELPDIPQGVFVTGQDILIQHCVYRI